jgi:DNA-binding NtrC family response regulator
MAKKPPVLRILIVDDESLIRWSLAETLTDSGHEVSEAVDARSAMEAATVQPPPDVIVLDFRLPDSSDLGLLGALRRLVPAASIIMMTAYGSPEMVQGALELGAYRVVNKPFEVNQLADLVLEAASSSSR